MVSQSVSPPSSACPRGRGRGQGSRELRRETSRTRQEFDSGHKISVISDQKQNDARRGDGTPVKGAGSQKTVEEAANVLRARQTDNPFVAFAGEKTGSVARDLWREKGGEEEADRKRNGVTM